MRFYYDSSGARVPLKTRYCNQNNETFGMFRSIKLTGLPRLELQRAGLVEKVREAGGKVYENTIELTPDPEVLSSARASPVEEVFDEIVKVCGEVVAIVGTTHVEGSVTVLKVSASFSPFTTLVIGYSDFLRKSLESGEISKLLEV